MTKDKPTGLALLREPFPANQISKLPKPTKQQTEAIRCDFKAGIRCQECGQWHHPKVVHLDYVGHAALTNRLLDCDPEWDWQPLSVTEHGLPTFDSTGGLWIKLTVCGVTRLGYGDADGKTGGNAIKEAIGDALRNAAMRFGAALDLWHKGDLHIDDADDPPSPDTAKARQSDRDPKAIRDALKTQVTAARDKGELDRITGGEKFKAALSWLAENDQPKANEVTGAIADAERGFGAKDDL